VVKYRNVANALALKVHDGHLREPVLTDVFEVRVTEQPFYIKKGELRVEVNVD